ncbi:rCG29646 [Rattus norvegicus]|uniref:RCG29646 n=1 Tax=Rattus norvegicus TaxID=10116 RepID=A6IM29_RAT|nr:rCG29646 [Rattus norvegicus]
MREKQLLCDLLSTVASLLRTYQSHYQNPLIITLTAKMKTSLEGHRYTT